MEEGTHELWPHPDALYRLAERNFQFAEMTRGIVGQFHLFEVAPDPFVRVEFGGIGGKVLHREPLAAVLNAASDGSGLVGLDVVPDEDNPTAYMAEQVPEEHQHLWGGDRSAANQNVELPIGADTGDSGELGPTGAVGEDGGLSCRGPGANTGGNQAEAGLVGEDQRGFLPSGFFLTRGHSCRSQRWTSRSSRSMARPVGLWYDHPHCRKSFGT